MHTVDMRYNIQKLKRFINLKRMIVFLFQALLKNGRKFVQKSHTVGEIV